MTYKNIAPFIDALTLRRHPRAGGDPCGESMKMDSRFCGNDANNDILFADVGDKYRKTLFSILVIDKLYKKLIFLYALHDWLILTKRIYD